MDKDCVQIVEEKLPSLQDALANEEYAGLLQLYQVSKRVSSSMQGEMVKYCSRNPEGGNSYVLIKQHPDVDKYQEWKGKKEKVKLNILGDQKRMQNNLQRKHSSKSCIVPI